MGQITRTEHLSWNLDGSEPGGFGPVQGATRPWFETSLGTDGDLDLILHAGYGQWTGEFALSDSDLSYLETSYDPNTYVALSTSGYSAQIDKDFFGLLT